MPFSLGVSSPLGPPRLAASLFSAAFGPSPRSGNAARSGTDHLRAMSALKQNLAQKSHARQTVRQNESMFSADAVDLPGWGYAMTVLRSQLPRKSHFSPDWRQALQLLARDPRGATEDVLELGHGFSRETLAMLALAGPPDLGGGINGATYAHSSSVRSLG